MLKKSVKKLMEMASVFAIVVLYTLFPISTITSAYAMQNNTKSHTFNYHPVPKSNQTPPSLHQKQKKCSNYEFCVQIKHPHTHYISGSKSIAKNYANWTKKHDPNFLYHKNKKIPKGHIVGNRKNNK